VKSKRGGWALIDVLVGIIILGIVLGALFQVYTNLWDSNKYSAGMSTSQIEAQQMATSIATAFRSAVQCTSTDSGCTVGANIESASSTGCTIYSRNSSNALVETTYAVNNGNYQTTVGSGTASTIYTGASLSLTYYSSSTYNTNTLTSFTPTSSTSTNLAAVGILTSITLNGVTSTYTTFVGLRNR